MIKKQTFNDALQPPAIVSYFKNKSGLSKAFATEIKQKSKLLKKRQLKLVRKQIKYFRQINATEDDEESCSESDRSDSDWEVYKDAFKNHVFKSVKVGVHY